MRLVRLVVLFVWCLSFASLVASARAGERGLKVMAFNTMCDFCGKKARNGKFVDRLDAIADTIDRHDPDLIGLQEVRTRRQVRRIRNRLSEDYVAIFAKGFPLSYADPALLVRRSRFEVRDSGGFWLGPNAPNFNLGWATAFPRRVQWALLMDRRTRRIFYFVSAHFDNNTKNKEPSARLFAQIFGDVAFPMIFAGDTNLRPALPGYATLRESFRDAFDEVPTYRYVANGPSVNADGCNLSKDSIFPDCRVDHVLLSRAAPWRTREWAVDTFRYPETKGFVSDHRAVVVELSEN